MRPAIPSELTPCYGRQDLEAEVRAWLTAPTDQGGRRLVTLTGVGGIGKTRLLLQVAGQLSQKQSFPDGVHLVELGEVDLGPAPWDRKHLPAVVSRLAQEGFFHPLGLINVSPEADGLAVLLEQLADKNCLLAVDGAEHVATPAAMLLGTVLRYCPGVRALVTSRHFLNVPGEQGYHVPPLPVPSAELPLEKFRMHPAVAILEDHAIKVPGSTFDVTDENKYALATIVDRVDGIPLALKLVASRLATMSIDDVLDNLFSLLTGWDPMEATYHQTLDALMASHWDLLTDTEQRMWECCSVFVGGFDLAAAVSVCQSAGLELDRIAVADVLTALYFKSILMREPGRYRMLDVLRYYGETRLAERGLEDQVRGGHSQHYQAMIQHIAACWYGPDEHPLLQRAEQDLPNLGAAMTWASTHQPRVTVDIVVAAIDARLFHFIGDLGQGQRWLEFALTHASDDVVLFVLARLSWQTLTMGDSNAARQWRDRALALVDGDSWPQIVTFVHASYLAIVEEDVGALAVFERAVEQRSAATPAGARAMMGLFHAIAAVFLGSGPDALALAREVRDDAEENRAAWAWAWALLVEAMAEVLHGSTQRGAECLQQAITLLVETEARWGLWCAAITESWRLTFEQQYQQAAEMLGITEYWMDRLRLHLPGLGGWKEQTEKARRAIQEHLSDSAYDTAYHRGRRIAARDDAVDRLRQGLTARPPLLSPEVYRAVVALVETNGGGDKEIARRLQKSPKTIEEQIKTAKQRAGVTSRTALFVWAREHVSEWGPGSPPATPNPGPSG